MTSDAELHKLPLEALYRELINRYLLLSPTKGDYASFMDTIDLLEKKNVANKPKLRAEYVELCKCMLQKPEDKVPDFFLGEMDD